MSHNSQLFLDCIPTMSAYEMLSHSKSKLVCGVVKSFGSVRGYASHYDVLGLTPKATQSDIKSAYYKLSMQYHPDKTGDAESAKKFRSLTEAYKVLGNVKLKKMYDKGMIVGTENRSRMDYHPEPEPEDPMLKFYKSHERRSVTPTMDGKKPIYDFDQWSKNHYGTVFQRTMYEKEVMRNRTAKRHALQANEKQESVIYLIFTMLFLFAIMAIHGNNDYDRDMIKRKENEETNDKK